MRKMLSDIFTDAGHNVIGQAANGEEAVNQFSELSPDLVTMDVMMRLKNGVEAVREIIAAAPAAKIVMISSIGQESMVVEAMTAGAGDYVVKPFRTDDVLSAANRLLED